MERPLRLLLSSELRVRNVGYEVSLCRSLLAWKRRSSSPVYQPFRPNACHSVCVSEIISVREEEEEDKEEEEEEKGGREDGSWKKIREREDKHRRRSFTVSYVERCRQHRWRCADVTFACPQVALCRRWVSTIREQLAAISSRPSKLLVYINPYGGKRQAKRVYQQKVAPLFALAGISTHVIVTEYANHARDHLRDEAELKKCDGVVCVGGDGMFSEMVHGLVWRTQKDGGVGVDMPDQALIACSLRIGIIPAGSTDCICFATVGTNDPVTSALHIIVGDSQPMDVCSVHHDDTFLRYSVSLLGYGFYGDVLTDSERKRWMGPARYDLAGLKMFLTHHHYEGTVSYLPAAGVAGAPRDAARCRSGCSVCQDNRILLSERAGVYQTEHDEDDGENGGGWRTIRGKFLAINAASMSCACPRSPKGLSPAAHLADGTADLILVRKCSRFNFLRHLLRHTSKDDQFDLSFVEVHRVRRFRFTPRHCRSDSEQELDLLDGKRKIFGQICQDHPACGCAPAFSSWNCDGEILPHTAIDVRVHCQLIQLFARGIEEAAMFDEPAPARPV